MYTRQDNTMSRKRTIEDNGDDLQPAKLVKAEDTGVALPEGSISGMVNKHLNTVLTSSLAASPFISPANARSNKTNESITVHDEVYNYDNAGDTQTGKTYRVTDILYRHRWSPAIQVKDPLNPTGPNIQLIGVMPEDVSATPVMLEDTPSYSAAQVAQAVEDAAKFIYAAPQKDTDKTKVDDIDRLNQIRIEKLTLYIEGFFVQGVVRSDTGFQRAFSPYGDQTIPDDFPGADIFETVGLAIVRVQRTEIPWPNADDNSRLRYANENLLTRPTNNTPVLAGTDDYMCVSMSQNQYNAYAVLNQRGIHRFIKLGKKIYAPNGQPPAHELPQDARLVIHRHVVTHLVKNNPMGGMAQSAARQNKRGRFIFNPA